MKRPAPRYKNALSALTRSNVLKGLETKTFGRPTVCLAKTASTNDVVLKLAHEGAAEGTVVTAEIQTSGRGRQGRKWAVTKGKSLALSILLKPKLHTDEISEITLAAAVAAAKTMEEYSLRPKIKWPNDLLLDGKKVCGILTELGTKKDKISPVILGMGINLNQLAADFPKELRGIATSIRAVSGRKVDRVLFLQRLLFNLEASYQMIVERKFTKVLTDWKKRAETLGSQVRISQGHREFYGQAVDVDEKGALLIRTDVGVIERIISGDVEVLKLKRRKRHS